MLERSRFQDRHAHRRTDTRARRRPLARALSGSGSCEHTHARKHARTPYPVRQQAFRGVFRAVRPQTSHRIKGQGRLARWQALHLGAFSTLLKHFSRICASTAPPPPPPLLRALHVLVEHHVWTVMKRESWTRTWMRPCAGLQSNAACCAS